MNAVPGSLFTVHPERMLTVTLQYPGQLQQMNVVACRYIAATVYEGGIPHRVVAIEVIRDPMNPVPIQPYQCYANLLEVIVLPANALLHLNPYVPYAGSVGGEAQYGQLG